MYCYPQVCNHSLPLVHRHQSNWILSSSSFSLWSLSSLRWGSHCFVHQYAFWSLPFYISTAMLAEKEPLLGTSLCQSPPMEDRRELQLLPTPSARRITGWALSQPVSSKLAVAEPSDVPSLDLQLSINHQPIRQSSDCMRKRRLIRREMELAQSEFARARLMWKKVQEEVENAERQKARATHQIDSSCMEITCQACQQRFRP